MTTTRRCLLGLVFAVVSTGPTVRGEVSAETAAAVNVLVLGVIEGPDPISQTLWQPVRNVDPVLFLNPDGALRNDGRPSIAFHPQTGWPHVTWAYDAAGNFQIGYSRWTGTGWAPTALLTSGAGAELDPRIHLGSNGTIYVVWWEPSAQRIWLTNKSMLSQPWQTPEQVTTLVEAGRRPAVGLWQNRAVVAYERSAIGGGQEIVFATRTSPGIYTATVAATTASKAPLDVLVHAADGKLWLDWRHAANAYAWVEWGGSSWGAVHTVPWTDNSWTGQEEARRYIADQALDR